MISSSWQGRRCLPKLVELSVCNPVRLKAEFGDQLVFWGGSLDCQRTLPFGTVDEVAREVEQHVRVFAPGGGYVFAPVHNIQAGVPPENVVALFDAAYEYGFYET